MRRIQQVARTKGGGAARRHERLNSGHPWTLVAPLIVYALLAGWIALSAANVQAVDFSILIYGLANLIVFTDALDFGLRLYVHRRHTAAASSSAAPKCVSCRSISRPLEAAATARNRSALPRSLPRYSISKMNSMSFMERLQPYRDHVWLISDGSTDHTCETLSQAGWRCLEEDVNRHKPGALRKLLTTLPPGIETVMVIDPDVRICGRHEGSAVELRACRRRFAAVGGRGSLPTHRQSKALPSCRPQILTSGSMTMTVSMPGGSVVSSLRSAPGCDGSHPPRGTANRLGQAFRSVIRRTVADEPDVITIRLQPLHELIEFIFEIEYRGNDRVRPNGYRAVAAASASREIDRQLTHFGAAELGSGRGMAPMHIEPQPKIERIGEHDQIRQSIDQDREVHGLNIRR